ncbi:uroporphyrin-III C-methyltransferase [Pseudohyphozyma bogoriensis]|nr:uroporphyrin-III C-methyltransferase [Pseudohyphozyma bogoriensis]
MLVALNDTLPSTTGERRSYLSAEAFKEVARKRRYLVNVADAPSLSDWSWPVVHRFASTEEADRKTSLQLGIATNTSACRLGVRIKREVVAALPSCVGDAVDRVGELREELKRSAEEASLGEWEEGDSEVVEGVSFNKPQEQLGLGCGKRRRASTITKAWTPTTDLQKRMLYISQLSSYLSFPLLAQATLSSISSDASLSPVTLPAPPTLYHDSLTSSTLPTPTKKGRIILLGTGTGSPLLLTRLAHLLLTTPADSDSPYKVDLFLSDKLVPQAILDLIPPRPSTINPLPTTSLTSDLTATKDSFPHVLSPPTSPSSHSHLIIAKKYPGNAENAQDELIRLAIAAAKEGKTVLRMKQGDPFLYGRGGEEVLAFRAAGFEPVVVPGLSSVIAGPGIAGIPVTQRGVAESMVVCTGVGRGGRSVQVDGYERGKTLVVLMGVARLASLVEALVNHPTSPYPKHLPMALIERASSGDQRVVAATVGTIAGVLERLEAHRPPGMLVVGWSVMCLDDAGDVEILDDGCGEEGDRKRVGTWLGEKGYRVREGLGEEWKALNALVL